MKDRPTERKYIRWIFFLYLLIIIRLIIFKYPFEELLAIAGGWSGEVVAAGLRSANFTFFKTIRMYVDYSYMLNSFENLVGNIVIFVPFGFLLPMVQKGGRNFFVMLLHALLFVLGIEIFQLFSGFGAFDVDDILLNCMGAIWGYLIYFVYEGIKKHKEGIRRE